MKLLRYGPEVGRQPWIVYGLMRTKDAVSPIATSQVAASLLGFIAVYTLLGIVAFYLVAQFAKEGPGPEAAAPAALAQAEGGEGHA